MSLEFDELEEEKKDINVSENEDSEAVYTTWL